MLVHGIGDGEVQGDFLVDVGGLLGRWIAASGGEQLTLEPTSVRRGPRPARFRITGRIPVGEEPGAVRTFDWHVVEARWSDEFKAPSERRAALWSLRTAP